MFFTAGGALREHADYPLAEVDLRAPVLHPPSIRLFGEGDDFVFGNTAAVHGPDEDVPYPRGSEELRSRPAVVAVIGAAGAIAGFTGANAWYAPDLPGAKRYDFALSLGPAIVTPDEYAVGAGWGARLDGASLNTVLRPGDLLVHVLGPGAPVSPGEAVEVTVDGVGVLKNRVA